MGRVTLLWDPNPEPEIAGYKVYWGEQGGVFPDFPNVVDVGDVTETAIDGLAVGATYFVVVTAYNAYDLESPPSDELEFVFQPAMRNTRLVLLEAEDGTVAPPMAEESDGSAGADDQSGANRWVVGGDLTEGGSLSLPFEVPEAGTWFIWCRLRGPGGVGDAFTVAVDGLAGEDFEIGYKTDGQPDADGTPAGEWPWGWSRVAQPDRGPRPFALAAGSHLLEFGSRVAGAALDRVVIVNNPAFVPDDTLPRDGDVLLLTETPAAQVAAVGAGAVLRVATAATGDVRYQWLKHDVEISGATGSALWLDRVDAADGGSYSVLVTSADNSVTTEPVEVIAALPGQRILSIERMSHAAGPAVRLELAGEPGAHVRVFASTDLDDWTELGTVANTTGSVTVPDPEAGAAARRFYRVLAWRDALVVTAAPQDSIAAVGERVVLNVEARATGPLYYEWLKNGSPILGASGSSLVLDPVGVTDIGSYSVRVTRGAHTVATSAADLSVVVPAPRIRPLSRVESAAGTTVTLAADGAPGTRVEVQASSDLSRWQLLGTATIEDGAVAVLDPGATGAPRRFYRVRVAVDEIRLAAAPQATTAVIGTRTILAVDAASAGALNYQWLKNGIAIPGATAAVLEFGTLSAADSGDYSVIVFNGSTSLTTNPVRLRAVLPPPAIRSVERPAAGGTLVRFDLTGALGTFIQVEASGNLLDWQPLGSVRNETGRIEIHDPAAATAPRRFYRMTSSALIGK